jgi:hypothetical protein
MVKVFEQQIGDITGDNIVGGTIRNFASTGIQDTAESLTLVVSDGKITVDNVAAKNLQVETINGNTVIRGDVKIYGILDAGFVRTTEVIANQRYEKQYLEFALDNEHGTNIGTGLLWPGKPYNKQFVLRANPDRFFVSESLDLGPGKQIMVNGSVVLDSNTLGGSVINSNLSTVGNLSHLNVIGNVNLADSVFFDATTGYLSVGNAEPNKAFSVYSMVNDVEVYIDSSDDARGRIGTANNRSLDIVTDDQVRVSVEQTGDITLGKEGRDSTITRVFGKLSVGIKNPQEQFEVAGNMRIGGKLFAQNDSEPTEGHYQKGDIVWNTNPVANSFIGWVCVQGGFPGQWKVFGHISE